MAAEIAAWNAAPGLIRHRPLNPPTDGRHPLAELAVDTFIPNDTCLTCDNSLAVITGPNFSGKSIYVKQCAVLVYLAMLGSVLCVVLALSVCVLDRPFDS